MIVMTSILRTAGRARRALPGATLLRTLGSATGQPARSETVAEEKREPEAPMAPPRHLRLVVTSGPDRQQR